MATIRDAATVLARLAVGEVLIREPRGRFHIQQTTVLPRTAQSLIDSREVTPEIHAGSGVITFRLRAGSAAPAAGPEARAGATRAGGPATSREAARHVDLVASQRYVWNLFRIYGPMTTLELQRVHDETVARNDPVPHLSSSRLRSACPELERLGYLRRAGQHPTGHTTTTGVRTHATVWEIRDRTHEAPRQARAAAADAAAD